MRFPLKRTVANWLLVFLLALLGTTLSVRGQGNPPATDDPPSDCETKMGGDDNYCMANPADACCEEDCPDCEGESSCEAPATGELENKSISVKIAVGRAPHESLTPCKLFLKVEQPSEDAFSPSGLVLIRPLGGEITDDTTQDLPTGVVRRVSLVNLDGNLMRFDFETNEDTGFPIEDYAGDSWRLQALDANGAGTTGSPVYYDFFVSGALPRSRFDASTGEAVSRTDSTGRQITLAGTKVEDIRLDGVLRQVRTASALADIEIPEDGTTANGTVCKYTIKFYTPSQVGTQGQDDVYVIVPGSTPYVTFTFENPVQDQDNDFDHMRITRSTNTGGTKVYDYVYVEASDQWTLSKGDGTATLVENSLRSSWDEAHTLETRVREIRDGEDALAARTTETRFSFSWGIKPVATAVAVDSNEANDLVTSRWYYDTEAGDYARTTTVTAAVGKLAARTNPDGSWALYEYDSDGRMTLRVRPWKDLAWSSVQALSPASAATAGRATTFSYTSVDTTNDTPIEGDSRPRTVTESIAGTTVSRTYHVYSTNASGESIHVVERAATPNAVYGAAGNLRTTTTYYAPTASSTVAGRVKTEGHPDGRLDTYTYETGTYASNATPSLCSFTSGTGDAFRTTVTHGTVASPAGVANRTTRDTTVQNGEGNEVLTETCVYSGTGYERISWAVKLYDDTWHITDTYRSDGTHAEAEWDCCGKSSETLVDGTEYSYTYDAAGRLETRTKECGATDIVISYSYDAAGRELSRTTTAGALSISTSTGYDLAGRVIRQISLEGLLTTTVYTDGGRTVTTTHPGGGTEIRQSYLDGRAKSSTGTYVTDTYRDYGVDTATVVGQTLRTTTTYRGAVPDGGAFGDIPFWDRYYTDPLSRTVRAERPAYGHTAQTPVLAVSTRTYDSLGRMAKDTNPGRAGTLYEYDSSLGELLRKGLDLDDDGSLDLASDRIGESSTVYEKDAGNDWWRVAADKVYSVETDDPGTAGTDERTVPVTVSVRRTRLTGLGGTVANLGMLVSEETSVDMDGNETATKNYTDSADRTVVQVVDSPFSGTDAATTTVNGLVKSAVSSGNLATTFLYDALGRRIGATDPRISSYDAQTDTWSNYNETHYNSVGQMDWVKDTAGNQASFGYDNPPTDPTDAQRQAATGRRVSSTNALGKTKRMSYTARGELYRVWGDTEYPLEYGYDENGRRTTLNTYRGGSGWTGTSWPTATAGTADTTTWNYEPETGLLESKEHADGKGPSYTYYGDGSLHTRTWERTSGGNALTTTYSYDPDTGQLAGVDYSDATAGISYTYTRTGNPKTIADATGTRTLAYTAEDKLHTETLSSSFYGATTVLTRSYDSVGRGDGYSLSYNGNAIQAPEYGHDTYGRFSSVGEGNDTFTYGYLANSDLLKTLAGPAGSVQTRAYETTRNSVDYVENKVGTTTVSKYDYTNDSIGRRSGVQKTGDAFAPSDTVTWSYDDRSQVTEAVATNDATYDYGFAYDPIGNRTTSTTKETGTTVTTTYTPNQLNQYTAITGRTNPAYDADGNLTLLPDAGGDWTLGWNGENRLMAAESSSAKLEFVYDYMGRRVERRTYTGTAGNWTLAESRRFLYDSWNLIAEFIVAGETVTLDRTHLWGLDLSRSLRGMGGVGGLLRTDERATGTTPYYPTYDANGNVSEYLDANGGAVAHYEYSPFGRSTAATGTKAADFTFTFSTKYLDTATGLHYYGYRYYSPGLGRWASRDPAGEWGGLGLYICAGNRSVDYVDVLGLIGAAMNCTGPEFKSEALTEQCNAAAEKVTNPGLRNCIKNRCNSQTSIVRCGRCDECKDKTLLGTNPVDPALNGLIVICTANIAISPFPVADVLVHEFAHECGWGDVDGDQHPPGLGVPDWPRKPDGSVDWDKACDLYPGYWKCTEIGK